MRKSFQDVFCRGFLKLFFALLFVAFSATANAAVLKPFVVYGTDDRIEVYEDNDPARRILAESVVAIMGAEALSANSTGGNNIKGEPYGEANGLCTSEKFLDQSTPAYCSGFLVAENIIATAGHCVEATDFCKDAKFVFGFMLDSKARDPNVVKIDDVYGCKRVLHGEVNNLGADFALVELDRPVIGRKPLRFAKQLATTGDPVFVIGHPMGLPAKIAGGANVRTVNNGFFMANLDTFGGNSGSAVFNHSYDVVGVLVRGESDFARVGNCNVTNRCADDACRGEDVTQASVVFDELEKQTKPLQLPQVVRTGP